MSLGLVADRPGRGELFTGLGHVRCVWGCKLTYHQFYITFSVCNLFRFQILLAGFLSSISLGARKITNRYGTPNLLACTLAWNEYQKVHILNLANFNPQCTHPFPNSSSLSLLIHSFCIRIHIHPPSTTSPIVHTNILHPVPKGNH